LFPPFFCQQIEHTSGSKATQTQVEAPDFLKVLMALISVFQENCQLFWSVKLRWEAMPRPKEECWEDLVLETVRATGCQNMKGWSAIERWLAKSVKDLDHIESKLEVEHFVRLVGYDGNQ